MNRKLKQVESRLNQLVHEEGTICVGLLDSENMDALDAAKLAHTIEHCGVKAILIGGSTAIDQIQLENIVRNVKSVVTSPVILFPGNVTGVSPSADAIFFSCLMNSDNPYFITQAQALAALSIRKYQLEAIPMGYLIIGDGGAAGFVGRSRGIPTHKPGLAVMYALAAQYFGMRYLYLEAGSGAGEQVSIKLVSAVRKAYDGTLLVGGGINNPESARQLALAGANVIVVGSLVEEHNFEATLRDICRVVSH